MELRIWVSVKFRIGFPLWKDLAKFNEAYRVTVGVAGLEWVRIGDELPADARKVLDRQGVKVYIR